MYQLLYSCPAFATKHDYLRGAACLLLLPLQKFSRRAAQCPGEGNAGVTRETPCVLLFDEFDAIGKERGDVHETGEIKRVVTSLLDCNLPVDFILTFIYRAEPSVRNQFADFQSG